MTDYTCNKCGTTWSVNDGKSDIVKVKYCFDCYLDELEV